ncbi:MAG: universal stress protein [Gammaproteobacteria bacterium]
MPGEYPPMLLCLDLEYGSQELARYAANRARRCRQGIVLLHVVPEHGTDLDRPRQQLAAIAATLLAHSRVGDIIIEQGIAEDKIVAVARRHGASLLILGRRRRPTVERIYVGSTTSAVISLAGAAVLVVPLEESGISA